MAPPRSDLRRPRHLGCPTEDDSGRRDQPRIAQADMTPLVDQLLSSLAYIDTLDNRQIGTHTWSAQLVPLIWCATNDWSCEQLGRALTSRGRGQEALHALRQWWARQGVSSPTSALPVMRQIAGRAPRCDVPRVLGYLHAALQERIVLLSGTDVLIPLDLVRHDPTTQRATQGAEPAPATRRPSTGTRSDSPVHDSSPDLGAAPSTTVNPAALISTARSTDSLAAAVGRPSPLAGVPMGPPSRPPLLDAGYEHQEAPDDVHATPTDAADPDIVRSVLERLPNELILIAHT